MGGNAQATATNQRAATSELHLRILELVEYTPDRDERTEFVLRLPDGDGVEHYGPIKADARHEKWVYVFRRYLYPDGSVGRASDGTEWISLRAEMQFDEEGAVTLVDWKNRAWYKQDERPADVVPKHDPIAFDWNPSRFELWVCLSHVQLPRRRIEQYLANEAGMLQQRCWKVQEHLVAGLQDGQTPYLLLFDPLHFAEQVHRRYVAAQVALSAYEMQHGRKRYHASLFGGVARGYQEQEKETPPGDVLDRIETFITEYQSGRLPLQQDVDHYAGLLYGRVMESPVFKLAREDATGFADLLDELDDAQLDRVDSEVLRQAELMDAASASRVGLAYLKKYLADERDDQKNWYERVALASNVTKRLAAVPQKLFETLRDDARVIAAEAEEALNDVNARRVRANGLLLEQLETVRLHVSGSQRVHVEALQVRILEPIHQAARPGSPLVLPGQPEYAEARKAMLSGHSPTDLDARLRAGRLKRSQLRALKAWQTLMPDPSASLQQTDLATLRLTNMDLPPTAGMPGGRPLQASQFRHRYSFHVNESGLLVARASGGRVALADASSVLGGGAAVRSSAQVRDAYVASLRQLAPVSRTNDAQIEQLEGQVERERSKLTQAEVEVELRTRQLNYAGRFLMALDVLDIATGVPDFVDKLKEGERKAGRGESWWASYAGAVQSGVGLSSAVFGATSGIEQFLPAAQRTAGSSLSRAVWGLRVLGVVGAVLGGIAAALSLQSEWDEHDTFGWASAGLAVGSSVMLLFAIKFSVLGWVGIVLGILSIIVFLFADTKLETQLRTCYWSDEEAEEVKALTGDDLRARLRNELQDLLLLLARPQLAVECWDSDGEMSVYENTMREPPTYLRLTLRPGLHPPGTTYEVTDFKLDHTVLEASAIDADFVVPDPQFDVVLAETVTAEDEQATVPRGFMRQWVIGDTKISGDMVRRMRMPPNVFSFEAVVHVRISEPQSDWNLDQSFKMRGPLGYKRHGRLFPSSTTTVEAVDG